MHEGQNKIARLIRLDQLLQSHDGYTLKELLEDEKMDMISQRSLQENLKELKVSYGAEYEPNLKRGREKLWRYKDTSFSIFPQAAKDMEVIRKSIENLSLFKGDPRYDMLRFYLMGLERGIEGSNINYMSFDNNIDVAGLKFVEPLLDAIIHHFPLKMWYKPFDKDEFISNIHPYHLRQYNRRWFIFAYSEEKEAILNYALDRITKLEHLSKDYIASDIDFEEYFDDIVGVSNYQNSSVEEVILKIDNKSIDYIRTKPLHWTQKEMPEQSGDAYTTIKLELKVNTELKMLLFSYSDAIEVIKPLWLRRFFAQRTKAMSDKYEA